MREGEGWPVTPRFRRSSARLRHASSTSRGGVGMTVPGEHAQPGALRAAHPFDLTGAKERLAAGSGGYESVHRSPGRERGVYVLVAPEPDRQQPHEDDEVYIVLEGTGTLEVEGASFPVREGTALFVEAGADHRFTSYESLCVLVIFTKPD